jgi:hypothetical protein
MSDTFANTTYAKVCQNPNGFEYRSGLKQVGDAGIKPTYIVREVSDVVYLSKNTDDTVYGVASDMPSQDLDTAYTITSDQIEIFEIGSAQRVLCTLATDSPAPTVHAGDIAVVATTDGLVMEFAYTDGTGRTDTLRNQVGKFAETKAGSATLTKLVKVNI